MAHHLCVHGNWVGPLLKFPDGWHFLVADRVGCFQSRAASTVNADSKDDFCYDTVFTGAQKSVTATVISESWNLSHFCNKSASISLMRVIFEKWMQNLYF